MTSGYRRHMDAARRRLATRQRRSVRDPLFGGIEDAEWGEGPALILSHPLFGGFDVRRGLRPRPGGPWKTRGLQATMVGHVLTDACGVTAARFRLGRSPEPSAISPG
jgi:hypothetical protein